MTWFFLADSGGTGTTHAGTSEFPGVTYEIAFGHVWNDPAKEWTDVTPWVKDGGIGFTSGRADELQPFDASTCTFVLDNSDRRFDPSYAAGPYFGEILPVVPVRVTAGWAGVTYALFYGFVQDWPQFSSVGNRMSDLDVQASDVLELFTQVEYGGGAFTLDDPVLGLLDAGNRIGGGADDEVGESTSGERVDLILDLVGQPAALRDVDRGVATVSADFIDGTPRDVLQAMEQAEAGWLFQKPSGEVAFYNRHAARQRTRMKVSQSTFTDADASMPYAGLSFSFDRRYVFNDVRRQRTGGALQSATDATSVARYFRRKHEITDLAVTTDDDAQALAGLFLSQHKEPALRPEPLVVDAGNDRDVLFPQVLGRQIGDRITLSRTPQEIGDPIEADYRVEGIDHAVDGKQWVTTWTLSPVDDTTYWTLDDPDLGLLDAGNLIGA